jgi:hypothetical protein
MDKNEKRSSRFTQQQKAIEKDRKMWVKELQERNQDRMARAVDGSKEQRDHFKIKL